MMLAMVIGTKTSEEILREIRAITGRELTYDDRLVEICEDSLKLQNFILLVEDQFDITLGMRETSELVTVSDLVELVENKLKK